MTTVTLKDLNEKGLFSNDRLRKLILPLMAEQLMTTLVGIADTMMVSRVGEHATGGVSLVDTITGLLILIFNALATGGSVVAAHLTGQKKEKEAATAAEQLVLVAGGIGLFFCALCFFGRELLLDQIYGSIEADVKESALIYFRITCLSYPFLAVYSAGTAILRAAGNSKITMKVAFGVNLINVSGNALLVMVLHMGTAGVAFPTLVCRLFGMVTILLVLRKPDQMIHFHRKEERKERHGLFLWPVVWDILKIGIPTGIDGSIFQVGRLFISSLVSTLGTSAIAANAVAFGMLGIPTLPANAVGLALVTVVGQCLGAGEEDQAMLYTRKLLRWAHLGLLLTCSLLFLFIGPVLSLYNLSPETEHMAGKILRTFAVLCVIFHPGAFSLTHGLRAGGDATFIMIVSISSMFLFRVASAYLFVRVFGWGLYGIWGAMYIDWVGRIIPFLLRLRSRKWIRKKVVRM